MGAYSTWKPYHGLIFSLENYVALLDLVFLFKKPSVLFAFIIIVCYSIDVNVPAQILADIQSLSTNQEPFMESMYMLDASV